LNNPVGIVDINGDSTFVTSNENGTYAVTGVNLSGADDDTGIYVRDSDGNLTLIGQSITTHSFVNDDGKAVAGAIINLSSTEGQDFIDGLVADDPDLITYMANATGGEVYDFKDEGIEDISGGTTPLQHRYRGSVARNGAIGSARDFGNIGAGIVAGRKGLSWSRARVGFDALESWQKKTITSEAIPTQKAQRVGHNIGLRLWKSEGRMTSRGYRKYKR
jgi:hypothetical protein